MLFYDFASLYTSMGSTMVYPGEMVGIVGLSAGVEVISAVLFYGEELFPAAFVTLDRRPPPAQPRTHTCPVPTTAT